MQRISMALFVPLLVTITCAVFSLGSSATAECISYEDYVQPLDVLYPPGYLRDFDYQDSYLYLIHEDESLLILDAADPASFVEVASLQLPAQPRDIDVLGSIAHIVAYTDDVVLLADVSDPSAPVLLSSLTLPASPMAIVASGTYAYVPAWDYMEDDHGLYVIDVADPHAPTLVDRFEFGSYPINIILSENHAQAYLLDYQGLWVIDLSTPGMPIATGFVSILGEAKFLGVRGEYVYAVAQAEEWPAYGDGLYMINVSDPQNPWIEGEYTEDGAPTNGVALWEQYAIVGSWGNGFSFIDISNPADMQISGVVGVQQNPGDFVVLGDLLFARGYSMASYELRAPLMPEPLATVEETGHTRWLTAHGNYAYTVRRRGKDFCVIDMSDPVNPLLVGLEPISMMMPGDIAIKECADESRYAYVADGWEHDGIYVIEVTNPEDPETLSFIPLDHSASDLEVEGDILYVMAGGLGLRAYDISNPTEPVFISSINFGFSASIVKAVGTTLYVGRRVHNHPALFVLDASDPANMQIIAESTAPTSPYEFQIAGSLLYIADGSGGLLIMDISDPENPLELCHPLTATLAQGIVVSGDYAYLADTHDCAGLQVINISDPEAPHLAGYFPCAFPCALELINDHILVGTYNGDLQVAPLQCEYSSVPVAQELAGSALSVRFELNRTFVSLMMLQPGRTRLTIHDIQGRLINRLHDGPLPAGAHDFMWNGRTREGISAASGIYYLRHRTESSAASTPVILMR